MCREKWNDSCSGADSRRLSLSVSHVGRDRSFSVAAGWRCRSISWGSSHFSQHRVSVPSSQQVCVNGLNAGFLNWSASYKHLCGCRWSSFLNRMLRSRIRTSVFSRPGEEQNKEALQDVEDEAQWDYATNNSRLSLHLLTLLSPQSSPPLLPSSSSVALWPSRVVELTSLFFSPFLFLY